MTYRSYLRLGTLLDIQEPLGPVPDSAEMLFIVDHQAHELWFKVMLDTLTGARAVLTAGDVAEAHRLFGRVHAVQRLLIDQIDVLGTMASAEFRRFRGALGSASGMQSAQYHELEFVSGAKDPGYLREATWLSEDERRRLARRIAEPTLWDAYTALLAARGLPVASDADVRGALAEVAVRADMTGPRTIAEDLLTYDRQAREWRQRHIELVERQIGANQGTGGTPGVPYLRGHLDRRYYPLLWDVLCNPEP